MSTQIPIQQRLCFSGHRRFGGSYDDNTPTGMWIKAKLAVLIRKAIAHGYKVFISGGALGLDIWAAEEVLRQRHANGDIRLVMAIPCAGQDARWTPESRERYRRILEAADCVHYLSKDTYKPGCMDARDRLMIANVGTVLAFLERDNSGTGRAVKTALSLGKKVVVVDPRSRVTSSSESTRSETLRI